MLFTSCSSVTDKDKIKSEILQTEKAFEAMVAEKGVAQAFYFFADDNAVINRGNDSLIFGKESIKNYYLEKGNTEATVNWTPDFIEVSDCGTLGYTYGKYCWKVKKATGDTVEYKGVFHTVWKKQKDKSWKYVWD